MMVAPISPSIIVQYGPANTRERSTTITSERIAPFELACFTLSIIQDSHFQDKFSNPAPTPYMMVGARRDSFDLFMQLMVKAWAKPARNSWSADSTAKTRGI